MIKGFGFFHDGYLLDFNTDISKLPKISDPDEECIKETEITEEDAQLLRAF
jgi:hypothetical protein